MRIMIAHCFYKESGGEDFVVKSEVDLLREIVGSDVLEFFCDNHEMDGMNSVSMATHSMWSVSAYNKMKAAIRSFKPDIIHVHNTFPAMSPSVYWAASSESIPVVQTLHNFRLFCLQSMFLRDGSVCELCIGRMPWRGVVHGCYRSSRLASAAAFSVTSLHRFLGTYNNKISRFIALNQFCKNKFVEGGILPDKICVKPNFVSDPGKSTGSRAGLLYVGRLTPEKGISTLAEAWKIVGNVPLDVAGDGSERSILDASFPAVKCHGFVGQEIIRGLMKSCLALVVPSIWYENFPRTIVEAYAAGLPVIASRIGSLETLVEDGKTGLLFDPGSASDLACKVQWATKNVDKMLQMGLAARQKYLDEYSPESNRVMLLEIYKSAISDFHKK